MKTPPQLYRSWLFLSIAILILLGSCNPPVPEISPTRVRPSPTLSLTPTPSRTPRPTITSTVIPSKTPIPTKTTVPSKTPTATLVPGPLLDTYLPTQKDMPQCRSLQYQISFNTATTTCVLQPVGSITIAITLGSKPILASSLKLATTLTPIDFPTVGDASLAGKNSKGDAIVVLMVKGTTRLTITYSTSKIPVKVENVLSVAKLMDRGELSQANPPSAIGFDATLNPDLVKNYFSQINFWILTKGAYRSVPEFPQGSTVCLVWAPTKTTRDTWTAYLVDKKNDKVLKKVNGEMFYQKICSGLAPSYASNQFVVGDEYEVRLVVGKDWVASFPFTTK